MQRILIACDKFKGSLSSSDVCESLARGLIKLDPQLTCIPFPLADGGEGTSEILARHTKGRIIRLEAHDPLMRPVLGYYGISDDEKTAFVEMSAASGLHLLREDERKVLETTTFGTGELMKDAMERGVSQLFVGIGGSATNDGATGAAAAIGYDFLDEDGQSFVPVGGSLGNIRTIRKNAVHPGLAKCRVTALCDVDNPLTGPTGAAHVYGPQKGASAEEVFLLDEGLAHLGQVVAGQMGIDVTAIPGAGGGGGFGGGAVAFFNAVLKSGIETVFEISRFEEVIRGVDLVITGEGKMDAQTLRGKVVAGVVATARRHNKPVIGITGIDQLTNAARHALGFESLWQLVDIAPLQEAMSRGAALLENEVALKIFHSLKK